MDDLDDLLRARELARSGEARRLRLAAPLSLGEMARAVGVSVATVSRWEAGERQPTGEGAVRWARRLARLAELEAARTPAATA